MLALLTFNHGKANLSTAWVTISYARLSLSLSLFLSLYMHYGMHMYIYTLQVNDLIKLVHLKNEDIEHYLLILKTSTAPWDLKGHLRPQGPFTIVEWVVRMGLQHWFLARAKRERFLAKCVFGWHWLVFPLEENLAWVAWASNSRFMHKGAHSKRLHWSFGRGFSGQLDCSLLTGFEHLRTELEVLALLLTGRHHRDDQEAVNCQVPISGRHMEKFLAKSARLCLKRAKARMRRTV